MKRVSIIHVDGRVTEMGFMNEPAIKYYREFLRLNNVGAVLVVRG